MRWSGFRSYFHALLWGVTAAAVLAMITFPFDRRGVQNIWIELFAGGEEYRQAAARGFLPYLLVSEVDALRIISAVLITFAFWDLIQFLSRLMKRGG